MFEPQDAAGYIILELGKQYSCSEGIQSFFFGTDQTEIGILGIDTGAWSAKCIQGNKVGVF
jgi:hypothetical protein